MSKGKIVIEHEINASKKMLFPYLNTASGLSQWFADDVTVNEDNVYTFKWDTEVHKAKIASHRTNSYVKFEFLENNVKDKSEDPWSIEFRLEENELTQSVFIKVIEYTEMDDEEEQNEIWENLFHNLKETVGG
jgi:uncharacterized protein YndB with AHSA1/START domain